MAEPPRMKLIRAGLDIIEAVANVVISLCGLIRRILDAASPPKPEPKPKPKPVNE